MIDITKLNVHWRDFDGKLHIQSLTPTDATNTLIMKKQIAEYITKVKTKAEYYYVVIEIEKADGKPAYRTIIPKTMLH